MEQVKFIMMVGIAGTGKSTFAKQLKDDREDIVVISSDYIREKMFNNDQSKNVEVFNEVGNQVRGALKNGKHVIMDATNINRKRRIAFLNTLPKNIEKIAIYISNDLETVIEQNFKRKKSVPIDVINRMYKNMQIPIMSEGWNDIYIEYGNNIYNKELPLQVCEAIKAEVLFNRSEDNLIRELSLFIEDFIEMIDLPQDNLHHTFSVSRHTYYVYKNILDTFKDDEKFTQDDKLKLLWTALLHDIGKPFCKNFYNHKGEKTIYANFIGHENVSSQIAVNVLKTLGYSEDFIKDVYTLIQYHMSLLNANEKTENKVKNQIGDYLYNLLKIHVLADELAK